MKTNIFVMAAVLVLLVYGCTQEEPKSQVTTQPAPETPSRNPEIGRYQVTNGTPSMSRNIMLLDTVTGHTWILCTDQGGNSAWCKMPKYETPAGFSKSSP